MAGAASRAAGFGGIMAAFSVGILVGPAIGSMLSATAASYGGCACGAACVLYVWAFIPESLTDAAREKVTRARP